MGAHSVVIIGGGIGGLATAIGLGRIGLDVTVLERAPELAEVGAGLQLTPNAVRALKSLGLDVTSNPRAVEPQVVEVHAGHSGRIITTMPIGQASAFWGEKWLSIHRADLHAMLLASVNALGNIRVELDWPVAQVERFGTSFRITHQSKPSQTIEASHVIGADGLWSRVRRSLGDVALPRPSGKTAWRATLPMAAVPEALRGAKSGLWVGPDAHLTQYPVAGGTVMNMVAIIKDDWDGEGWSSRGDAKDVRHAFRNWCPLVKELLSLPQEWMRWPLVDRPAWYGPAKGAITLLGDAAHPMVPFLAQGAASSLEDASVLTKEIAASPDEIASAMRRYEALRLPRVQRIQAEGRKNGDIYHLSGPMAFGRDMVMRITGGAGLLKRYDWIYGWEP